MTAGTACFSCCQKADNELADVTLSGSLFQNCAAATGNARPPTVEFIINHLLHYYIMHVLWVSWIFCSPRTNFVYFAQRPSALTILDNSRQTTSSRLAKLAVMIACIIIGTTRILITIHAY